MVFFWPWRHNDASPASFEKTLSALSTKIATTQRQLDRAYSTSRRVRVLGTLYLGFAYLVYAIVILLVVGWKNMGAFEWTALSGCPVLIYLVRSATGAFFNFRIETLTARLKEQQGERTSTIQKLKEATKYDSTLQLLEKYGDGESKPKKSKKKADESDGAAADRKGPSRRTPGRTGLPPPPTANIPRGNAQSPRSASNTPQPGRQQGSPLAPHERLHAMGPETDASAEFAPNAFGQGGPVQYPSHAPTFVAPLEPHWYDRILDALMGDDEMAPKNRIVLICQRCRQVNGQAPPGTKSLAELGSWKCMACGALNGEIDEGEKIVRDVLGQQVGEERRTAGSETTDEGGESSDLVDVGKEEIPDREDQEPEEEQEPEPEPETQSRKRKGKKKN